MCIDRFVKRISDMLNVLYIGPNCSEWAEKNRPVSVAASRWARGFLTALSKCVHLLALTHSNEVAWPKGKVFWRGYDERLYPNDWECVAVSYPVLKYLREYWWRWAYARKVKRILRERKIDVALFYNCCESWQVGVMKTIKEVAPQVKIYPVILDGDDPRKDNWGWMKKAARYADGFIPMSWWVYKNCPCGLLMYHFDGGSDGWNGVPPVSSISPINTLVHTGSLDQWRGLDFMIDVVKRLSDENIRFVMTGKSTARQLAEIFGANPRVVLPGFVDESEMVRICNSADVLLNVRNPIHPDNILNYPSKLPHYLSFGRPVVSTRLQSLAPNYNEVLHFPEDDSVEKYVETVKHVLTMTQDDKQKEYEKIQSWFNQNKQWDLMVGSLVDWLEDQSQSK